VSNPIVVRFARKEDFTDWLPLWEGYNAFYGREGKTSLPLAITHATWSRFFDADEPMHAFVAESDGALAGLAHIILHRSTILAGPACYLQDLFTSESARGKGVARALIEAIYAHARKLDCPRVYWMTHESNATAMQLYDKVAEKSGFVVYKKLFPIQ
jgi:GNAT superfamily N-acetyltransferase